MNDQTTQELPVARDQRREELAQVDFAPNGQLFQPKNGRELMDMANMMSTAGFMVKDIYRKNPGACMGLIAVCAPYGMNPIQVSWKTYQTKADGPIAYEAQVMVAMVNSSGAVKGSMRYRYEGEGPDRVCIASATLVGDTDPVEVRSPRLADITPKNSPLWKADPDQQLAYYTGRNWARRYKPEMLLGVYDVDELDGPAIGPSRARDVTPTDSRLAQKVAAARGQALPPTTAPDAPPIDDAETVHWTDSINPDNGVPGSEAWTRGLEAYAAGQTVQDCPYDADMEAASDWIGAWHGARKAAE